MREITLEELLEAGCHFGHQVTRQNPKARDFVFEARDNIHIIDLAKTKEGLEKAAEFIKALAAKDGSTLLVVATKRQAAPIVSELTKDVNDLFTVTSHWVGGTLTNFFEVSKNVRKLKDLQGKLKNEEEKAKYTKREIGLWEKEVQKLEVLYGGTRDMQKVPDAIFVIDTHLEELAVREAHRMGVPIVGIVDTNADPTFINYPIPANDDAVGSVKIIAGYIIDSWVEGKTQGSKQEDLKETNLKEEVLEKEEKKKTVKKETVKKVKPKKEKKEEEK